MPTSPTPIDALPPTPNPDDAAGFDSAAYNWSAALPTFRTQTNDAATNVYNNAVEAATSASTATTKAAAAATSEANAAASANSSAASANSALNAPGTNGTSTTALTIAAGPVTLTTQTGKAWAAGQPVRIARTSDASNSWMYGTITAYDGVTGSLTVDVKGTLGAGTFTDWTIALSGAGVTLDGTETLSNKKLGSSQLVATPAQFDNSKSLADTEFVRNELLGLGNAVYSAIFGKSLAPSGYQKLPSGLMIQWGNFGYSGGSGSATFPVAFQNACFVVTLGQADTNTGPNPCISSKSTTGFSVVDADTTGNGVDYIAIGY